MSNGEILVSEGEESKNGEELIKSLPPFMPKDESSDNFKLLDVVGRLIDRMEGDFDSVDNATSVKSAESIAQLSNHGALVNSPPKSGESLEHYRTRIKSEYQITTAEGTPNNLIVNVAELLETKPKNVQYSELSEAGVISLGLPAAAVEKSSIEALEFAEFIGKQAGAGYRAEATIRGTFTYRTPSDYNNGTNDSSRGYDTLDGSGNPTGSGGTYAGLI
jgi:hypothetical protein